LTKQYAKINICQVNYQLIKTFDKVLFILNSLIQSDFLPDSYSLPVYYILLVPQHPKQLLYILTPLLAEGHHDIVKSITKFIQGHLLCVAM